MSLTSCYRYVLQLSQTTLNDLLRAVLSEEEGAGLGITSSWEDVVVGEYTADVAVRRADPEDGPSSLALTAADLGVVLHLELRAEITIDELPELGAVVYFLGFDLSGIMEKTTDDPPVLIMRFPGLTPAGLSLVIDGSGFTLSVELIEDAVHELYSANQDLAHNVQTNVTVPLLGECMITTDIFDDEPGNPGFRGAIRAEVPSPTEIILHMPGHFRVQGISQSHLSTDMTVDISLGVDFDQVAGNIRIRFEDVASVDVTVAFATPHSNPAINTGMMEALKIRLAEQFTTFEIERDVPSEAIVRELVESRILEMGATLQVPLITTSAPSSPEQFDMRTFVPTTLDGQALALQLDPLGDGTPCDPPDIFARATGFALAIAPPEVDRLVHPYIDDNLGSREVQGYDVDVTHLALGLRNADEDGQDRGHLWLDGTADVAVDCWPDPTVNFWGPVFLVPHMQVDGTIVFEAQAGTFDADEPCCGDVDPSELAALVEGSHSTPVALPRDFSGVGSIQPSVTEARISRQGIIVFGDFTVVTATAASAAARRRMAYWASERAGS